MPWYHKPQLKFDITIIGAGILGTSLAYFLSHTTKKKILVLEQAPEVAYHTSKRNTGKVHAPFLYDPKKRNSLPRQQHLGLICGKYMQSKRAFLSKRTECWKYRLTSREQRGLKSISRGGSRTG